MTGIKINNVGVGNGENLYNHKNTDIVTTDAGYNG